MNQQQTAMRFGPAGNSVSFYAQGYKRTEQAPAWLAGLGLNAMEYSAGRGVNIKDETARSIGAEAQLHGISMSIHAPYFINLANSAPERYERNLGYILESARTVHAMGGNRVVLHVGSCAKMDPDEALRNCLDGLRRVRSALEDAGLGEIRLCPETMGKSNQIGDFEQVLTICELDETFLPAIDFAHLHARGCGALQRAEDFDAILERMEARLGRARIRCFHMHFCRIEFTRAGEKRHWTFADTQYGPEFSMLAPLLVSRDLLPTIICESAGTMAEDACAMRDMVRAVAEKVKMQC